MKFLPNLAIATVLFLLSHSPILFADSDDFSNASPKELYDIGEEYLYPSCANSNPTQAKIYLERAFQQDVDLDIKAQAAAHLGDIWLHGDERSSDDPFYAYEQALSYFQIAADHGKTWASGHGYLGLARLHYIGIMLQPNSTDKFQARAHDNFLKAFNQSEDRIAKCAAAYYLCEIYYRGKDVEKNEKLARSYYAQGGFVAHNWDRAAKARAHVHMGESYYREGLYERARSCFEAAAEQKDNRGAKMQAYAFLGELHYYGYLDKGNDAVNFAKAREFFELATNHVTNVWATNRASAFLGDIYFYGKGVRQNFIKARNYYQIASWVNRRGIVWDPVTRPWANLQLGKIHYAGLGVKKDEMNGLCYFSIAARQDDDMETKKLAQSYLNAKKPLTWPDDFETQAIINKPYR